MDPTNFIPQALPIPVEWGWFYLFQMLTFILHILVMNVMLGASIIALVHHLRGKAETEPLTKSISVKLPFTIAFAVNFGVAPLLFIQILYGQFIYTSSVLMAVYWLSVVGLVIIAYASAYIYDFSYVSLGRLRTVFIAVTTVCLLTTAFIYTNNMTLMLSPALWEAYFDNPWGTLLNTMDPSVLPRYLHFVASSVAVAGLALALFYRFKVKNDPGAQRWVRHGMNWYAYTTMVQMALGLWFLSALPEHVTDLLLGGSLAHTLIFVTGATIGIFSISNALSYNVGTSAILSLTTIILMLFLRDLVRDAYLAPYFQVSDRVVTGEYLPLVLFILTLAAGLCVVAWMLRTAATDSEVRS
jgi:hypothetical protein